MHFFIDHTALTSTSQTIKYGPDSDSPTTLFNVTSKFQLGDTAKAFACVDSLMFIQQYDSDPTLVNVILKPIGGEVIPFDSIKYIIYRGVLLSSFINGSGTGATIVPQASGNTEFIAQFWTDWYNWCKQNTSGSLPTPTPECFGYDGSNVLSTSLNVESIYSNSQPGFQAIFVKEAEWIGNFTSASPIGLEIIVDTKNLTINLDYLRSWITYQVDATSLSGFGLRVKGEKILSYIDPAAFFGLHYNVGVSVSTYDSEGNKTTVNKKQNDLYTTILYQIFATCNRVYLDIRNEIGSSYNFYQNYGDSSGNNIQLGNSTTTPVAQAYNTNGWPILFIEGPMATTASSNDVKLDLRIDKNLKPLLYTENTGIIGSNNRSHFIDETVILNGTAVDWSNDLSFYFPNTTGSGGNQNNVAYYLKLFYNKQPTSGISWFDLSSTDRDALYPIYEDATTSALFNGIATRLNNSKKLYKVVVNSSQTLMGMFIPYLWGGYFSFNTNSPDLFGLIEEFFHAYQSEVGFSVYEPGKGVNKEFEAKVFCIIVMNQKGDFPTEFPYLEDMITYISSNYTGGVPTLSEVQSSPFHTEYLAEANDFQTYFIANPPSPSSYIVTNAQIAHVLENAYTE